MDYPAPRDSRRTKSTPASRYTNSPQTHPSKLSGRLSVPDYPSHFLVKKVTDAGTFRFQHKLLANSLVDQHVGSEETDDGLWSIYFNIVLLAKLDKRYNIMRGSPDVLPHVAGQFRYRYSWLFTA